MKTVYVVFNDREKISVSDVLMGNLNYVFKDHARIKICFLDELEDGFIPDGDLFLVLYENRIPMMKKYIASVDKVMALSRTIQKQFLPQVFSIPEGTDVLVVNDSQESTLQTINNLYALGLNHLNLIPFMQGQPKEAYAGISVAITPNEMPLVPDFVESVLNIQDRYVDLDTCMTIIKKLGLSGEQLTRNLLRYSSIVAETNKGVNEDYVTEHLKNQMLKKAFEEVPEAVLVTNKEYKTVYSNEMALRLFHMEKESDCRMQDIFGSAFSELLEIGKDARELFQFKGTNYIVNKSVVKIVDQIIGYIFTFNDEKNIKDIGNTLNKRLVKRGLIAKYTFGDILWKSAALKRCIDLAETVAETDHTVLIAGESGTGKELFAQSIHNHSARNSQPFVAVNCAALPETLLESELFGYEKGAFTGASANGKVGLFEQANHGTIFLDEIGDMSLNLQARLLRVLQEKQLMRLGSDKIIDVDIRIIAATNRNLQEAMEKREFREDLYYRLSNIPLTVPPLRQRREDILHIFSDYIGGKFDALTAEQKEQLISYDWPGNVRELKNAADYFNMLGELPPAISECKKENADFSFEVQTVKMQHTAKDMKELLYQVIAEHTAEGSGIGRLSMIEVLKAQGVKISDDKVRKLIRELEQENRIIVGKGRAGCRAL